MKIIEFRAENVKKLSLLELKLEGTNLVVIAGRNGQGKSSVLDSIEMALGGERHLPAKPVRKGQEKGSIELDLGEYRVRRTLTPDGGGSLTVYNKDGIKQPSPQTILDDLYARTAFDPMAFLTMKPADQAETLRQLLGLDFSAIDKEREERFDERTVLNRDIKAKEAMIRNNPRHEGVPAEEQSAVSVMEEQRRASERNTANQQIRDGVALLRGKRESVSKDAHNLAEQIDSVTLEIDRLQKRLAGLEAEYGERKERLASAQKAVEEAEASAEKVVDIDLAPFTSKITEVERTNLKIRKNKEVDGWVKELNDLRRKAEKLTDRLEAIDREKREVMAKAKFPVPGLGFDEANRLTFDGIPFENANTAEQIKVSVAMGMALNPKLRVLLIKRGNDLDEENLRLLAELAQERDYQVWIERVSTAGKVSVILEDGHAMGDSGQSSVSSVQCSEDSVQSDRKPAVAGTPNTELKLQ